MQGAKQCVATGKHNLSCHMEKEIRCCCSTRANTSPHWVAGSARRGWRRQRNRKQRRRGDECPPPRHSPGITDHTFAHLLPSPPTVPGIALASVDDLSFLPPCGIFAVVLPSQQPSRASRSPRRWFKNKLRTNGIVTFANLRPRSKVKYRRNLMPQSLDSF